MYYPYIKFFILILDNNYHIMVVFSQMSQLFKTIYFQDFPASSPKKKNLKIAFSDKERDIYEIIAPLSSQEIREILGYASFSDLKSDAEKEYLPVNTYCLRILRDKVASMVMESQQPYLPGTVAINPVHATFRGGREEPLHMWYPFLEGYSPEFVENIINEFAPKATCIFDPFAGTGTTPLTAARCNKMSYYCEINPLLQYLIEIKVKALTLNTDKRLKLIERLKEIKDNFAQMISTIKPDNHLVSTYSKIFGDSKFFDEQTFEDVLKCRTMIDFIACSDPLSSEFFSIAVVSSLVPASLLKRAGDLRYKTHKELAKEKINFKNSIIRQLSRLIADLYKLNSISRQPILICEDAKKISLIPPLDLDAVITSPPYLNGTNYFRNTKIELWFLRCLRSKTDLTTFREKSVTGGINDVTLKKNGDFSHPFVDRIVNQLQECAYDTRIPKMVEDYFREMDLIFESLQYHLRPNSVIAVDIGDSIYAGIHVPTDRILTEIMLDRGYRLKGEILLRKRLSRNGARPLCQILLIFTNSKSSIKTKHSISSYWNKKWEWFKNDLPHQSHPFSKRNWGHPLHSLCSYQGKMKPSLAHFLVKSFLPEQGKILDPFAGVGTIPFEASLQGHESYGFEISPAAMAIASAKVKKHDPQECERVLSRLADYIETQSVSEGEFNKASMVAFNKSIKDYYEKNTLKEILLARRYFIENPPNTGSEYLVLASLLHILHGNRPYALSRRSHPITPFSPKGPFEYRPLISRLREKVKKSLDIEYPETFKDGNIYYQDATKWWPQEIDNLDAIITSPPFFDSTRFYLSNWIRLWFCGWEAEDFRSKPLMFIDERQKTDFSVYEPIFRQARERLKKDGIVVLHLGMSKKCNMAEQLSKIASKWFRVVDIFSEDVRHCESHGIKDKGTVKEHQYMVLI